MYLTRRWTFQKLGMDPEFEFVREGHIVRASEYWSDHNYDFGNIGTDGSGGQIELRPKPSETPEGLVRNCQGLLAEFCKDGRDLSIRGGRYALGAHIHFGLKPHRAVDGAFIRSEFGKILDWGLGKLLLPTSGSSRRTSSYYILNAIRTNEHGFEYRSLPSSIFHSKRVLTAVLKVCHGLAKRYFNGEGIAIDESHLPDMCGWDRLVGIGELSSTEREAFQRFVYDFSGSSRGKRIIQAWGDTLVMPPRPIPEPMNPPWPSRTSWTAAVPAGIAAAMTPHPLGAQYEVFRRNVASEVRQQRPVNPEPDSSRMYNNPNQHIIGNGIAIRFTPDEFSEGLANYIEGLLRGATWGMTRPSQLYFYGMAQNRGPNATSIVYQGRDFLPRSRMPSWSFVEGLRVTLGRPTEICVGLPWDMRIAVNLIGNSLIVTMLSELMRGLYVTAYAINRAGSPGAPASGVMGTVNYETGAVDYPVGVDPAEPSVPLQHTNLSDGGAPRVEEAEEPVGIDESADDLQGLVPAPQTHDVEPSGENDACETNNSLEVGRLSILRRGILGAVPFPHRDDQLRILCSHCSWHNPVTHRCESYSSHHRAALVSGPVGGVNEDYRVDCCSDFHDAEEPLPYYVGGQCQHCLHRQLGGEHCRNLRSRSCGHRVVFDHPVQSIFDTCSVELITNEPVTPEPVTPVFDTIVHVSYYAGESCRDCGYQTNGICYGFCDSENQQVVPEPGMRFESGTAECSRYQLSDRVAGAERPSDQPGERLVIYLTYYAGAPCRNCFHQIGGICHKSQTMSYNQRVVFPEGTNMRLLADTLCGHQGLREGWDRDGEHEHDDE